MIYNLPESKQADKDIAYNEDVGSFLDITEICETTFERADVTQAIRLGKKFTEEDKPRPLLLKLSDEQKKKLLFKKLELWRKHQEHERMEGDDSPLIIVAHDMSQEQRIEKKAMLQEAKLKSEELPTESPHRFVVRGPPWHMSIKKITKPRPIPTNQ